MESLVDLLRFFKGRKVLITGHTGFKGSWLTKILLLSGADIIGYSLKPTTSPNLFGLLDIENKIVSIIGDIRDYDKLLNVFDRYQPEFVFHLAAQPIVRESYKEPRYTYDVNVMGTVNILECARNTKCVKGIINVTTDKVYQNIDENNYSYKEDDKLNGFDPYSNSKSCSELVTDSYNKSFLKNQDIRVSTVRAGNVIGGGDFSRDRIIPDCIKSLINDNEMIIRNPSSIRPYQHVLEPLFCYLHICKQQLLNGAYCGSYNVGPNEEDCVTTENLVKLFNQHFPDSFKYSIVNDGGPHEASFLRLSNSKIKSIFAWQPKLIINEAVKLTAEWVDSYLKGEDINKVTEEQILAYIAK